MAFIGVSLVVLSQPANNAFASWWPTLAGLAISLAAVAAAALTSLDLAWGERYAREINPTANDKDAAAASILGTVLAATAIAPCLFISGLLFQPEGPVLAALISGIVIGVIIRAPFTILLRIANFNTTNVTINAIIFLSPLLSLGFLAIFGYTTGVLLWVAVAGGAAIVAANILLASQRMWYWHR